jgi:hypothetical protein
MRKMTRSRRPQAGRHPRRFQRRPLRLLGRYSRFVIVFVLTVAAGVLGYILKPVNYQVPSAAPAQPIVSIMASRPNVSVTVTEAALYDHGFDLSLTASTVSGNSKYELYVGVSEIKLDWIDGKPVIESGWSVASDGSGEYSIGRSYTLHENSPYQISVGSSFAACDCVFISGPYIAVNAISLEPDLLGPQNEISSNGYTLTPVGNPGPYPGRGPGKYYATSVSSIEDDEIDLSTSSIPIDVSVVKAYPQTPSNPYSNIWKWSNVTNATLTLVDIAKQGDLSDNLFYAGIFLGIAGAGILALVPEVSRVIESITEGRKSSRRRRKPIRLVPSSSSGLRRVRSHRHPPNYSGAARIATPRRAPFRARNRSRRRPGPYA